MPVLPVTTLVAGVALAGHAVGELESHLMDRIIATGLDAYLAHDDLAGHSWIAERHRLAINAPKELAVGKAAEAGPDQQKEPGRHVEAAAWRSGKHEPSFASLTAGRNAYFELTRKQQRQE